MKYAVACQSNDHLAEPRRRVRAAAVPCCGGGARRRNPSQSECSRAVRPSNREVLRNRRESADERPERPVRAQRPTLRGEEMNSTSPAREDRAATPAQVAWRAFLLLAGASIVTGLAVSFGLLAAFGQSPERRPAPSDAPPFRSVAH